MGERAPQDPTEPGEALTQSALARGIPVFLEFLSP